MSIRIRYAKVLAPIDFSDRSRELLQYAAVFAREHEARLIILHVVEPVIYSADLGTFAAPLQTISSEMKKAAQEKLAEWAKEEAGISVRTIVVVGTPFQQITDAAAREKADLIILSTHGFTGLKHILLGSTAERVVRHATCPVLTLPRNSSLTAGKERPKGRKRRRGCMTKFFGARVCPKDHPRHAGKFVGAESFKPLRLVLQTQPRSAKEFCHAPRGGMETNFCLEPPGWDWGSGWRHPKR